MILLTVINALLPGSCHLPNAVFILPSFDFNLLRGFASI